MLIPVDAVLFSSYNASERAEFYMRHLTGRPKIMSSYQQMQCYLAVVEPVREWDTASDISVDGLRLCAYTVCFSSVY